MNNTLKRAGLATASAAMLGAVLAGCGGDADTAADKAEDKAKTKTSEQPAGEASEPTSDELDELRVLANGASPGSCKPRLFTVSKKPFVTFGYTKTMTATVTYGSTGSAAREAQCLLSARRCPVGKVDGIFGKRSMGATTMYQHSARLKADGIIGPQTWRSLRGRDLTC
ncbi:peptidoglycan-binding domain-containing protein [Streptomyces apocyni]|uniref:peptidoglycan-binding domain-containing protein n=1 Tax=Streptomyces apocyni TaxID=2654677 RepID=UPI0012EA8332|nr:peptidoglycan-binding domain-containing protein [Streptomyces apocyni]